MAYEGPERWRDEDHWPEIGSEAWFRAEISAGRHGEEIDKSGRGCAPAATRESVRLAAPRAGCRGRDQGECTLLSPAPLLAVVIWAAIFVLYALHVYV